MSYIHWVIANPGWGSEVNQDNEETTANRLELIGVIIRRIRMK